LFDEGMIRIMYEDNHADSYDAALKAADSGRTGFGKPFHKLMKAAEMAFYVRMGGDMPAPRNNFLHRRLFELARVLDLDEHQNAALGQFLADLCPCGKTHNAEAIRKLKKRIENRQAARQR
jgi:hypothetical protein